MSYTDKEYSVHDNRPVELYRFTQGATVVGRFTSADEDKTVDVGNGSETYVSQDEPVERTQFEQSKEVAATRITVTLKRDNAVAVMFKEFAPFEKIDLVIYRKHDGDSGYVVYWQGEITQPDWDDDEVRLTAQPRSAGFGEVGLRKLHAPACQHVLGDPLCGVDLAARAVSVTLSGVSADGYTLTGLNFATLADGRFELGWVELDSGERIDIQEHAGTSVVLLASVGSRAAVSDVVTAYPGCKKRFREDCIDIYGDDNGNRPGGDTGKHFGGFPTVPTDNPFITGFN